MTSDIQWTVGEDVVVHPYHGPDKLSKVARITKVAVETEDGQMWNHRGEARPKDTGYDFRRIRKATSDDIAAIKARIERDNLLYRVSKLQFSGCTNDQLRAIIKVVMP